MNRSDNVIGVTLSCLALFFYVLTIAPTVYYIDSGELATVSYTLGIAHPTGYPLFTLLGYIFSRIPLALRIIEQVNLLSSILCSVGIFFFFKFLIMLFYGIMQPKTVRGGSFSAVTFLRRYTPPIVGTLAFAFSETFWSTALSVEVYSLHIFFICVLLYLFTHAIHSGGLLRNGQVSEKYVTIRWILFAYVFGLAFTNHMTTILLVPGFLYYFFYVHGFRSHVWKHILVLAIPFLSGLSVYMYLPVQSANFPLLNWGNPVDLEKLIWHLSGKVYRVWIFSSTESAAKQFTYFYKSLPAEFGYVLIASAVLGLSYLYRNRKVLFIFTLILFLTCLGYSINYDIHDIDSYFLLAYAVMAAWICAGALQVFEWSRKKSITMLLGGVLILLIPELVLVNYSRVDKSGHTLVEKYTKDMLDSVEPNSIIISYQWDYFVSASYYMQIIESYRSDVVVIDKELLRRTWYFIQLRKQHPWLIENSKMELDLFLSELEKFEHDRPYNPATIEYRYTALIKSIIEKNIAERPVYVTPEIEDNYTKGFRRVPSGLAFRLYGDTELHGLKPITYNFTSPKLKNTYDEGIIGLYARSYFNYALYSEILGKNEDILNYVEKALEIKPDLMEAVYYRNRILGRK